MSEAGTRVLGYGRQSQMRPGEDPLTSLSLNGQEDRFRDECERRGWVNLGFIRDHDLKGDDPTRPGIVALKERCARGDVDAVWIVALTRFSNDYLWQGLTYRELKRVGVKHLISVVEGVVSDEFILGIHGLVSGKRITEMKVHLRNAMARRARDGGFPPGRTPPGFRRPNRLTVHRANGTSYERETGEPVIEPEGAALMREVVGRVAAGQSMQDVAEWLETTGAPTPRGGHWWPRTVYNLVANPIYVGDIQHRGVIVAHNPAWQIVDRETWERAQLRLANPVVVRNGRDHWLEGLVVHGCGHRMYYSPRSADDDRLGDYKCRTSRWITPLRCGHDRPNIAVRLLDRAVRLALVRDLGAIRPPAEAIARAHEIAGGTAARRARVDLDRRLANAEARWQRNHERFSEGKLPPETMDVEDGRLASERAAVAAARAALPSPPDPARIAARAAMLAEMADVLPHLTDAELRALLTDLGRVVVDACGVRIEYGLADPAGVLLSPVTVPAPKWAQAERLD